MIRDVLISILIVAIINLTVGCSVSSKEQIKKEELIPETEIIHQLVLTDGGTITFNEHGGSLRIRENYIEGKTLKGFNKSITLKSVSNLEWLDVSMEKTHIGDSESFLKYIQENETDSSDFEKIRIIKAKTKNVEFIFDADGGRYVSKRVFVQGFTIDSNLVEIDPDKILYPIVYRTNTGASIAASFGILILGVMGLALIVAALKESCPFVYSFNGERYVFDAEPLGGATTKGLERSELSKLEHLKPINGKYKILVKNEVPETQYLDEMKLLVVDHPPNTKVYPDLLCDVKSISNPNSIIWAKDENGNDISKFIRYDDEIFWQTKLPFDMSSVNEELRHTLTFAFPKPKTLTNAKLIINAGTSLWGSHMIREMQSLYGDGIDNWYDQMDKKGVEYEQMMQFIEREELYIMNAWVNENGKWISKAKINGGGPFVTETRSYDINLNSVISDTLLIKFNIPYGFWTLNYVAIEYGTSMDPIIQELNLTQVVNEKDEDITSSFTEKDNDYYVMPNVGDYFYAESIAPPILDNYERTIFLKSNGYYKIHLDKDKPIQSELLFNIATKPGEIVKYALQQFNNYEIE